MTRTLAAIALALSVWSAFAQDRSVRGALIADRGLTVSDFPKATRLDEHVYAWSDLHTSGIGYTTNSLIVITTDGVLVADGQGTPDATRKMVEFIKTRSSQPIKYVVVGSEHGDHTGGNEAFPPSATFISSPFSQANLERQSRSPGREGRARKTVVPTETVTDRRVVKMGSTQIEIVNNGRAHTGGDLEVHLPKEGIFFASEVFSNHIFPSMRTAAPSEWIQTLRKVREVDARLIVPGHGFVEDAATLKTELANFQDALQYVVAEVTRLHKLGLSADEGVKQADWGPYARWSVVERNAPIAVQRIYEELEGKLK